MISKDREVIILLSFSSNKKKKSFYWVRLGETPTCNVTLENFQPFEVYT